MLSRSSLLLSTYKYNPTSDIALLLHMNGANGSSSFVDSSQYNHAITLTGAPTISTTQSKFGGASSYFRLGNNSQVPRDKLTVASNNIFNFGSNDFTIECFVYFPEGIITTPWFLMEKGYSGGTGFGSFVISCTNTTIGDRITFVASSNGTSSWNIGGGILVTNFTLNTWHHIAIVRYGNTWKGFWNGVQSFVFTSALPLFSNTSPINLRLAPNIAASSVYIDEVRIISGRAEYIDNFTPPTSQFPDNFNNPPPTISITTPISGDGVVESNETYLPLTISGSSTGADSRIVKLVVDGIIYRTTAAVGGGWSVTLMPDQIPIASGTVTVTADVNDNVGKPARQATTSFTLMEAVDPYFSSVSLLLHMDGSNNSTSFVDSSSNAFSITRTGDTKISTTQSKFNGSSAYFDGSGDWLTISDNVKFQFGTGDFTIESWFYIQAFTDMVYPAILGNGNTSFSGSGSTGAVVLSVDRINSNTLFFGTNTTAPIVRSTTSMVAGQWQHVAITRSGSTVRLFYNGSLEATATNSQSINISNNNLQIGRTGWDGANGHWNGYIDELRITKGVARYTSSFTVPNKAFPNA